MQSERETHTLSTVVAILPDYMSLTVFQYGFGVG
jgi:hypothetical protein